MACSAGFCIHPYDAGQHQSRGQSDRRHGKQSEELALSAQEEFEEQPEKIWETNIFGKSLNELVREELSHKLSRMPDDARGKIRETLEKIINESAEDSSLHHPRNRAVPAKNRHAFLINCKTVRL